MITSQETGTHWQDGGNLRLMCISGRVGLKMEEKEILLLKYSATKNDDKLLIKKTTGKEVGSF